MSGFSLEEVDEIDRLWRSLPVDHVWTGWAAAGEQPATIWIFRTQAHWRRFPLKKRGTQYVLFNEQGNDVAKANTLSGLLKKVNAIPGIDEAYPS